MKKTQKKTNRLGKTIGALLLSAVLLAGGGEVGYGAGTHWTFKNNGVQAAAPDGDLNAVNGNVLITGDENESHGIRLTSAMIAAEDFDEYGIDMQAETAQILTATFTPANTTFQTVNWTVSGGDGKVTVTPVAGSRLQATVAVTGSFSQQAVVTCTSEMESNLSATATVDYLKRPTFNKVPDCLAFDSIKANMTIPKMSFFENSTGTLSATRASGKLTISNEFEGICKQVYSGTKGEIVLNDVDLINNNVDFTFDMFLTGATASQKAEIYSKIAYWADGDGADVCLVYYENISYYYGDSRYYYVDDDSFGELYLDVNRWSDVITYGESVELDQSGLVFFPPQN